MERERKHTRTHDAAERTMVQGSQAGRVEMQLGEHLIKRVGRLHPCMEEEEVRKHRAARIGVENCIITPVREEQRRVLASALR
jgi:hypothetical protein